MDKTLSIIVAAAVVLVAAAIFIVAFVALSTMDMPERCIISALIAGALSTTFWFQAIRKK